MKIALTIFVAWITFSSSVLADFLVTTDRAVFQSLLLEGYYTETFENPSFVLEQTFFAPQTFSGSVFLYTANTVAIGNGNEPGNFFTAGSATDKWLSTEKDVSIRLDFGNTRPTAIGGDFFFTDSGNAAMGGTVSFTLNGDTQNPVSFAVSPTNSFVGFYGDVAINSLVVAHGGPVGNYITVNNLTVGISAVPEPHALTMLGVAVFAWNFRRRIACLSKRIQSV